MIDENGQMLVYIACIEWGEESGGTELLSVHDTYGGASEALKAEGYRPACVFCSLGEIYACKGKTADEHPFGFIDKRRVGA